LSRKPVAAESDIGPGAAATAIIGNVRMMVDAAPRATVTVQVAAAATEAATLEWELEPDEEAGGGWLTAKVGFACCS
jgi:hypothetical protein